MIRTYVILFLFLLSVFILTAGGRVASSDETAFFLETQSLVEHGTLAIPDSIVSNASYGKDGRLYVGGGIGYTLMSVPFYTVGKWCVTLLPIPEAYQTFILKGFFSLANQFICALIGLLFFVFCRRLGYSAKGSFFLTAALLFSTNLFPYAKSSMREPLLTLCLLGAAYGLFVFKTERQNKYLHLAGLALFYLLNTKISFIIVLPLFAIYFILIYSPEPYMFRNMAPLFRNRVFWKDGSVLIVWIAAAGVVIGLINYAQFGSVFSSGYTGKPQPFNNPLGRGLFGLLLSPGKSFFIYAPITILIFWAAVKWYRRFPKEALFFGMLFMVMLFLHAKYFAWAGDGSWGSRYLIPMIPFFVLPVGLLFQNSLEQRKKLYKFAALSLCGIGIIIQLGGTSVYLGSYLRYIGEYPYTKDFSDPEFLHKSRYEPAYSPVIGHWRLFGVSIQKHLNGEVGTIEITDSQKRIPLSDPKSVTYLIDYWFMYMFYAGMKPVWILLMMGFNFLAVTATGFGVYKIFVKAEGARV